MWIADLSSLCPQTTFLIRLSHSTIHLPHHPRAMYQTTRDGPYIAEPIALIQPSRSYPVYPASSIPFCRNHGRGSCLCFNLTPSLPDGPCAPFSIMVPTMAWSALFSWDLWVTNYIFSGNHLLTVASTHLSNNKTYKAQHLWWAVAEKNNSEGFPQL